MTSWSMLVTGAWNTAVTAAIKEAIVSIFDWGQ
jgi:hypothetical protein